MTDPLDTGDSTNLETQIPNDPSAVDDQAAEDLKSYQDIIPEAYADKGHFKDDIKSVNGLFEYAQGLKVKLSEKPSGIPGEDATDEIKAAYLKDRGVPETHEGYTFTPEEGKEFTDEQKAGNEEMAKLLHSAKVDDKQFAILSKGINGMSALVDSAKAEADKKLDDEFDGMVTSVFGGDQSVQDKALQEASLLVASYSHNDVKPYFNELENKAKIVVASVLAGIRKEFIASDALPTDPGTPLNSSLSDNDIRSQARTIMGTKEYGDTFHPGHAAAKAKVDTLYSQLSGK